VGRGSRMNHIFHSDGNGRYRWRTKAEKPAEPQPLMDHHPKPNRIATFRSLLYREPIQIEARS
jgi:hypothetical protein